MNINLDRNKHNETVQIPMFTLLWSLLMLETFLPSLRKGKTYQYLPTYN